MEWIGIGILIAIGLCLAPFILAALFVTIGGVFSLIFGGKR